MEVLTPSATRIAAVEHTPVKGIWFDARVELSPWRSDSFLAEATKKAQYCAQTPLRGVKGGLQRAITTGRKQHAKALKGAVAKDGEDKTTHKGAVAKGGNDSDTHKGGVATGEQDTSYERKKRECRARVAAMRVARAEGKDTDEVFRLGRIAYNAEQ